MTRNATAFVSSLALALALCAQGWAQDKGASAVDEDGGPVTAYLCGRIIPIKGDVLDDGVILVQDGVIKAIGPKAEVSIPRDARRVDAADRVAMPGLVHPGSLAFTGKTRYSTSSRSTSGNKKISESLAPDRDASEGLARAGYTTVTVIPTGGGFSGLGCLLRPVKGGEELMDLAEVLREDGVILSMGFAAGTASKDRWRETLKKARKYITDLAAYKKAVKDGKAAAEAEQKAAKQKPKEEASSKKEEKSTKGEEKKSDDKGKEDKGKEDKGKEEKGKEEKGKEDKGKEEKAKEEKPKEPKKDAKLMPLVDVLEGRQVGLLAMASTKDLLHFGEIFESEPAFRPTLLMVPGSGSRGRMEVWRLEEPLRDLGVPVVMSADVGRAPRSQTRRVEQRLLLDAGVPLALVPGPLTKGGDDVGAEFRFRLSELVRHGLREAEVLRAVTLTPAEILGIQERCGSLEVGKDADLLFFRGHPLAPTAQLMEVLVAGERAFAREESTR